MTLVIIICAVLAVIVLAVILAHPTWAIRTNPRRLRANKPYRRRRNQ